MKTLEFYVKEIREERLNLHDIQVPPTEIGLEIEEVRFVKPIDGHIQLSRHVQDVYVKANCSTWVEVECRRCVEPFETEVETDIEVEFRPQDESKPIDPLLVDAGERYYSEDCIDLSEEARQAITLEIPIWPLCAESCKGLCLHCGENLNIAACDCKPPETVYSPFAGLADLLEMRET